MITQIEDEKLCCGRQELLEELCRTSCLDCARKIFKVGGGGGGKAVTAASEDHTNTFKKRKCLGCEINHPNQKRHTCLYASDSETDTDTEEEQPPNKKQATDLDIDTPLTENIEHLGKTFVNVKKRKRKKHSLFSIKKIGTVNLLRMVNLTKF